MAVMWAANSVPYEMQTCRQYGSVTDHSQIDDQQCVDTLQALSEQAFNDAKRAEIYKQFIPYYLEQCWSIEIPTPYYFTLWQPWVGGYHGEISVGYSDVHNYITYIWVDQDVKKAMGY